MTRLGLAVNETKTRIARLPEESVRLPRLHGRSLLRQGRAPYIGTRPSRKAVRRLLRRIHDATTPPWHADKPRSTVARISRLLRGWCGYFNQGPVLHDLRTRPLVHGTASPTLVDATQRDKRAPGIANIPDEYLYETLGLYALPRRRADLPRAKA